MRVINLKEHLITVQVDFFGSGWHKILRDGKSNADFFYLHMIFFFLFKSDKYHKGSTVQYQTVT